MYRCYMILQGWYMTDNVSTLTMWVYFQSRLSRCIRLKPISDGQCVFYWLPIWNSSLSDSHPVPDVDFTFAICVCARTQKCVSACMNVCTKVFGLHQRFLCLFVCKFFLSTDKWMGQRLRMTIDKHKDYLFIPVILVCVPS